MSEVTTKNLGAATLTLYISILTRRVWGAGLLGVGAERGSILASR